MSEPVNKHIWVKERTHRILRMGSVVLGRTMSELADELIGRGMEKLLPPETLHAIDASPHSTVDSPVCDR